MTTKREKHLLRKYGLTEAQYDDLLRKQDGRCAVCNRTATTFRKRLAVDHDHSTGEIRGLLCTHCNRYVVGRHRKATGADLLFAAYTYLVKEYSGWLVPPKRKKRKKRRARKTSVV